MTSRSQRLETLIRRDLIKVSEIIEIDFSSRVHIDTAGWMESYSARWETRVDIGVRAPPIMVV